MNLPLIILCLCVCCAIGPPRCRSGRRRCSSSRSSFSSAIWCPKLLALARPYRFAKVGVRVMQRAHAGLRSGRARAAAWSERLADAVTPASTATGPFLSEDELETLVELSAEEGALHETESEMIQEIIKLGDKTAKDCMTPRVDAFAVPDDLTNEELIPRLRAAPLPPRAGLWRDARRHPRRARCARPFCSIPARTTPSGSSRLRSCRRR